MAADMLIVQTGGRGYNLACAKIDTITSTDFTFLGGDDYEMLKDLPTIGEFGTCEEVMAYCLCQVGATASSSYSFQERVILYKGGIVKRSTSMKGMKLCGYFWQKMTSGWASS